MTYVLESFKINYLLFSCFGSVYSTFVLFAFQSSSEWCLHGWGKSFQSFVCQSCDIWLSINIFPPRPPYYAFSAFLWLFMGHITARFAHTRGWSEIKGSWWQIIKTLGMIKLHFLRPYQAQSHQRRDECKQGSKGPLVDMGQWITKWMVQCLINK